MGYCRFVRLGGITALVIQHIEEADISNVSELGHWVINLS